MMLQGGIIGLGRMGITHFSILHCHPDVQIAAVCDTHSFVRKNAEAYLGVKAYSDYEEMLEETKLDFVVVATPTAAHKDAVECALQHRLHVFVEKPFTLNPKQGRELVLLAQEARTVNQVGYVVRFNDVFMQVKKLLSCEVLGKLLSFKMEMSGPTVLHDVKGSWRSKGDAGGGCLYDFASHAVDLINYLIGAPDNVSGTVLQPIHSTHVEDAMCTTYFYRNGLWGNLIVNWSDASYRKPTYRLELLGKNGKIIADMHSYKIFFRYKPTMPGFTEGWNQRYVTDFAEPVRFYLRGFEFTRQLDYFIDRIKGNRLGGICSFANGLETDEVIARIRESAQEEKRGEKWIA
jgi:predicted dehydrogenase